MGRQGMELEEVRKAILKDYQDILLAIDRNKMMESARLYEGHIIARFMNWFFPVRAITLGTRIFTTKADEEISASTITHQMIHMDQQRELGLFGFMVRYIGYYLVGLCKTRSHYDAYLLIPFEQEAYKHQANRAYIFTREPGSWRIYGANKHNN